MRQGKTIEIALGSRQPVLQEALDLICGAALSENPHQGRGEGVQAELRDGEVSREGVFARAVLSGYLVADTTERVAPLRLCPH